MTIKDFQVGQTVIIAEFRRNRMVKSSDEKVAKVGRKYLTIDDIWNTKFEEPHYSDLFLVEKTTYGESRYLFPSREAFDNFVEHEELVSWIKEAVRRKIDKGSLTLLREIKEKLDAIDG